MKNRLKLGLLVSLALLFANRAHAGLVPGGDPGNNDPPPAGPVILDLNGTPIPHTYQNYTATFTATSTSTNISFAFRQDPAFLFLANVSVTTGGGPNLLTNGDFSAGIVGNTRRSAGPTSIRSGLLLAASWTTATRTQDQETPAATTTIRTVRFRRMTRSPRPSRPLSVPRTPSASISTITAVSLRSPLSARTATPPTRVVTGQTCLSMRVRFRRRPSRSPRRWSSPSVVCPPSVS